MTHDSEEAGSAQFQSAQFQSADSAQDGDLSDSLAIDSSVAEDDGAAPGLPTAESPRWRGPRHSKNRKLEPDLARLDAAGDDTMVIPTLGPDGTPREASSAAGPGGPAAPAGPAGPGDPGDPGTPGGGTAGGRARRGRGRGKGRRKAPWWELPLLVAVAIVIAVLVKTFVIQPFYIPSQSMEKTLHGCPTCKGDRILVNKPIYDLRDPHPGDIVVFHAPPGWDEPTTKPPANPIVRTVRGFGQLVGFVPPDGLVLVKRVIATGGQTVKGDAAGHVLISSHGVQGPFRTLDEPFVYEDGSDSHAVFGPVTVPKGRLWVMGDHRNDSADSRFHCGSDASQGPDDASCDATASTVPIKDVIGKAVVIAWPPSRWRLLGTPSTFKSAAQALGGAVPAAGTAGFVLPFYFRRRRRRRRG